MASALFHCLFVFPGLVAWLCQPAPDSGRTVAHVRLRQPSPQPTPGRLEGLSGSPPPPRRRAAPPEGATPPPLGKARQPGSGVRQPRAKVRQPDEQRRPSPPPREVRPEEAGYPQHLPTRRRANAPTGGPSAVPTPEGQPGNLSPPVLLKGPLVIPLPPILRQRGGRFLISLKCVVAPDGSSQVSVMDGTGMIELDEAIRQSFSGLPWYRGEENGQPARMTVRLTLEASWRSGEEVVHWQGRLPGH